MATEFISVIKSSGGEFTTLNLWWAALTAQATFNLRNDVDVVRVYSISNAGTFADNATLAYTGTAGGHCIHMNAAKTQMLVLHHTAGEHFATGGTITSGAETATVTSTIGGGEGDHAIAVAEVDGEVTHTVALGASFASEATTARTNTTNRLVIRSLGKAKRSSVSALYYGSASGRILYDLTSASSTAMFAIGTRYLTIEDIDIVDTDATHTGPVVSVSGQATTSMEVVFNRVVIQGGSGATTTQCFSAANSVDGPVKINNCVFYSTPAANGRCVYLDNDSSVITNSSFFSLGDTHAIAVLMNSGSHVITNCYARAGGDHAAWSGVAYATMSYCASNDATGTPAGLRTRLFSDTNFEGVTTGEEDFRIKEESEFVGIGFGVADTGLAEDEDIFGTTRTSGAESVGPMDWVVAESHNVTGSGTLPVVTATGNAYRTIFPSGTGTLGAVTATGNAKRGIPASGTGTLGSVTSSSGSVLVRRRCTGSGTLPSVTAVGYVLCAPTDLHCNDTDAAGGTNNPTGIIVDEPHFSCVVGILDSNIVEVEIQVSAAGDVDWSDAVKWDSGWLTLSTPRATAGRTADITYLQEA
jgi:hypothetical protein